MKRKYTMLSTEDRLRVAGIVSNYLSMHPKASTAKVHRWIMSRTGLTHVTYGCIRSMVKRIVRHRRPYKHMKKRMTRTVVDAKGQHAWDFKDKSSTLGSCHITYSTGKINLNEQAIALLKAAVALLEGGKSA